MPITTKRSGLSALALLTATTLAVSGCVGAARATPGHRSPNPTGSTTTTSPPATPASQSVAGEGNVIDSPAGGLRVGLSYGDTLPFLSTAELDQALNDAVSLGAGWIRVDLAWDDIQPSSPGSYAWSNFDRVVAAARARHLSILAMLAYTPAWARPPGCSTDKCAPAVPGQFATFATAAVARYAPLGIHDWEIWNEPNTSGFWQPAPDPGQYVALLKAVVPAMRSADPSAFVLSGGLAPDPTGDGTISQLDYLTGICRAGGLGLVDAVGYHPYSFPYPPGYATAGNAWTEIAATPVSFRSIVNACGYPAMKIWLTEYGAPTNGPGAEATASNFAGPAGAAADHVSEQLQAEMATQSFQLSASSPDIGALFWYTDQDMRTNSSDPEDFYGLLRADGSKKPAYLALCDAIAGQE